LLLIACTFAAWCTAQAQVVYGCTDPLSSSYKANATVNDGSCTYGSASVSAESTVTLPTSIDETSGLIIWNNSLYTINDDTDTNIYRLDPVNGNILQTIALPGTTNQDWEEIAQDAANIYIGDFGNNVSGNRNNLNILKISKASLLNNSPVIEYINFSYANQTSFTPTANNATDFDCEAMVVTNNGIYLFTKQWTSQQTSLYSLPKTPGTHVAQLQGTLNVSGLITGATYLEDKKLVVLSGYSTLVSPFMYLLYDFQGQDFLSGNRRKVTISASFHQIEAIATVDGLGYYLTNEHLQQGGIINVAQKLHYIDMSQYLQTYLDNLAA
ncbi:MAG: T9SS C-terminal target domain-containing protein, partial [Bacteroidota bacterium]